MISDPVVLKALERHPAVVKRFKEIQRKITRFPHTYSQETFGEAAVRDAEHPCGTAACIAGQYALVKGMRLRGMTAKESRMAPMFDAWCYVKGRVRLPSHELTNAIARDIGVAPEKLKNLFVGSGGHWIEPYASLWNAADGDAVAQAAVGVARIEHFLTYGK